MSDSTSSHPSWDLNRAHRRCQRRCLSALLADWLVLRYVEISMRFLCGVVCCSLTLGISWNCCPMLPYDRFWCTMTSSFQRRDWDDCFVKTIPVDQSMVFDPVPSGLVGMFGFSNVKRSAPVSKRDHSGPGRASHAGSLRAIDVASFTKFELYWMDAGSRCNRQCKGFGASHTLWESISYASLWKTPTVEDRRGRRRETERQVEGEVADRLLPYLYRTLRRDCWDVRCNSQIGIPTYWVHQFECRGCWKNRTSALHHGIRVHSNSQTKYLELS